MPIVTEETMMKIAKSVSATELLKEEPGSRLGRLPAGGGCRAKEHTMTEANDLRGKAILMIGVALDELTMLEGEPDQAKTRAGISSVRATLSELLHLIGREPIPTMPGR
jgi:hypothetical protein